MHNDNIALEDVEKEQIKLKSDLGYIKQGKAKNNKERKDKERQ